DPARITRARGAGRLGIGWSSQASRPDHAVLGAGARLPAIVLLACHGGLDAHPRAGLDWPRPARETGQGKRTGPGEWGGGAPPGLRRGPRLSREDTMG